MIVSTVCVVVFGGIELAQIMNVKSALQNATDSAALAAARQVSFMGSTAGTDETVERVVKDMFFANTDANINESNAVIAADYSPQEGVISVDVTLDANTPPLVRYALKVDSVHASSKARITGSPNVCVIGLEKSDPQGVGVKNNSALIGRNCGVYANSTSARAIEAATDARVTSQFTCAHGGALGGKDSFSPAPNSDCPTIDDPLVKLPEPSIADAPCDYETKNGSPIKVIKPGEINPGVYCGGLELTTTGKVTANPGIYVIRGGNFKVDSETQLYGRGVSFFLKGKNTSLIFAGKSDIDLEAPAEGEMAGILFFDARTQSSNTVHLISSPSVKRLVGVLYLPQTELSVDVAGTVADESPWTAIIARKITLLQTSQVVLNSDFATSLIPAPAGIQGSGPVRLVQ